MIVRLRGAGYRDGGNILTISPSLLVVLLLLPSESPSLHAVPWLGATQGGELG